MKATGEKPAIVLIPIGDVSADLLDSLVAPLSATFGLPYRIAAPIPIPPAAYDHRRAFAQAVKALIESNARYKIVIRYWTKGVEGKSEPRELPIEGSFQGFYQKVLEY
jgi:hypothetical protein